MWEISRVYKFTLSLGGTADGVRRPVWGAEEPRLRDSTEALGGKAPGSWTERWAERPCLQGETPSSDFYPELLRLEWSL